MRRGIVIGVAGVLAVLVAAAAGSPASSIAAGEVRKPNTEAIVLLGESRGYEVALSMPTPRVAVLHVAKFREEAPFAYAQSSYGIRVPSDALERGVIRLRFPSMGRVALRFEPSGKRRAHRLRDDCRGKRDFTDYGRFRGTVSLEGEGGSFKLETRSAEGALRRSFRLECSRKGEAEQVDPSASLWQFVMPPYGFRYSSGKGTIALLSGMAEERGRTILFRAAHHEGAPPGAEVQVMALEWVAGMPTGRLAFVESSVPGTLTTSMPGVHPASATLAPPAPFHGEESYLEGSSPDSHTWTGNLGVSFPGLDLPLTGAQFKTSLCVVSPLKVPAGCDFIKRKSPAAALASSPWELRHP
jgi:hypothetical protein